MVQIRLQKRFSFLALSLVMGATAHAALDPSMVCQVTVDEGFGDPGVSVRNYSSFEPPLPFQRSELFELPEDEIERRMKAAAGDFETFYNTNFKDFTNRRSGRTKDAARALLAEMYNKQWLKGFDRNCKAKIEKLLREKDKAVNVYVYIGGFGRHVQLNQEDIDAGEVVKWINQTDENALIISLGWSCDSARLAKRSWCEDKSKNYFLPLKHPTRDRLVKKTEHLVQAKQMQLKPLDEAGEEGNEKGYNEALAHAIEMAAQLTDIVLAAEIGNIHFFGYSLGAHAVSELLTADQDVTGGKEGFPWSAKNVCSNGQPQCRISELDKVKWGLALGLPGWSPALRYSYNGFQYGARAGDFKIVNRTEGQRKDFENGGFLKIADVDSYEQLFRVPGENRNSEKVDRRKVKLTFKGKLLVFNKRYDPTSVADDSYLRGVLDAFYKEYNHYGHDYNRPYFWNNSWKEILAAYLKSDKAVSNPDLGIVYENTNLDFQECPVGRCNPESVYAAHKPNLGHFSMALMQPKEAVNVVEVEGPEAGKKGQALSVVGNQKPLELYAMDQEDLRGAVEFSWQPKFDLARSGKKGLFSYQDPEAGVANLPLPSTDLLPEAYVDEDGSLVFSVKYTTQGVQKTYSMVVNAADLQREVKKDQWAHVSFNWSLPTKTIWEQRAQALADNKPDIAEELNRVFDDRGISILEGLQSKPRTSNQSQIGQGKLEVYINRQLVAQGAPLGERNSSRACLDANVAINKVSINILKGIFAPYNPYNGYALPGQEAIHNRIFLGRGFDFGRLCKAVRVRNPKVLIGQSADGAKADSLFDNVRLIFGEGRKNFPEVKDDGTIKSWAEVSNLL